jgi:glucan-binding YG repeat protein
MFRVNSYQAVLRVLLASAGLMVCGAVAQDKPNDQQNQVNQDQKSAEKPAPDAASAAPAPAAQTQPAQSQATPTQATPTQSAQAQPAADAVDPLKRPNSEKQRAKNSRGLKQELSKTYKKWLDEDVSLDHHRRRARGLQAALQRRRTRQFHRGFLATPRPHSRHRRERI